MKALIIDDEPDCVAVLSHQLAIYCPQVQVMAAVSDSVLGLKEIRRLQPDLVFLDIEMPKMNGFQLLDELGEPSFTLIFTTAYDQFAVKAFKYAALDYLLKPIDPEELKAAVAKTEDKQRTDIRQLQVLRQHWMNGGQNQTKRLAMPYQHSYLLLEPDDILYCESDGSYTRFFLKTGEIHLITRTLGEVENIIQEGPFFRVHKSWLVNVNHVRQFFKNEGAYLVMTDGRSVPIARNRKQGFQELFMRL